MNDYGYGLWLLVAVNSAVFIIFAASFFHPHSRRDWKAMGGFSAFIVALMVEMYGFPLTIYLLSGWAGSRFKSLTLTHDGGHLWSELIGWKGDPHLSPFHLWPAWPVLLGAAKADALVTTGPYARVRHPQYVGFLAHHGRLPAAVADGPDPCRVPGPRLPLPAAVNPGGGVRRCGVPGGVDAIRKPDGPASFPDAVTMNGRRPVAGRSRLG